MPFYFLDLATVKCTICGTKPGADIIAEITDDNAGGILYAAGWRSDPITCPACNKPPDLPEAA